MQPRRALGQEVYELRLLHVDEHHAVIAPLHGQHLIVRAPACCHPINGIPAFPEGYLVKSLGIDARILLGLPGYTPTWQTTRISFQGKYLPMHQPLRTLYRRNPREDARCLFCGEDLRHRNGWTGPFAHCWFCLDRPSWHHGRCCPHNSEAREWNGLPHRIQHFLALCQATPYTRASIAEDFIVRPGARVSE